MSAPTATVEAHRVNEQFPDLGLRGGVRLTQDEVGHGRHSSR
ncbi:hypothetical protein [Streptomyces violaceusniger]|uniref:Uncharacterized protein n=1 Tax=Streptomyces violaceusniger (strain Tu 4113) TaxID=653045 RepID=G2PI19_STRV4|nr:hypothetical protein [Streptomyces violaceusniger]AEM88970.1 hypothetical protein Strvi_0197 [Streptomyces violaceusniger Tu 4113]